MNPSPDPDADVAAGGFAPAYRTGAAARLAGMPVETLRVWERRYGVIGPRQSPRGHRLYSAEDVSRLALVRQLVELGNPIGDIAGLPTAALRQMLTAALAVARGRAQPSLRVEVVGAALAERIDREAALRASLEVVARCAALESAADALRDSPADVLAVEIPVVQSDALERIDALVRATGVPRAVIEYRFAPEPVLRALRDRGHVAIRAPLDADAIELAARPAAMRGREDAPAPQLLAAVPAPRFDDVQLARFAQSSSALYCECPRHLVDLLQGLGAFERYSSECANRSPEDAALHRHLQRVAGSARVLLEDALERVARAEGLPLREG
ncbi:MAG: MerR family transcriptional regulator [Burkholderiales bacterium]